MSKIETVFLDMDGVLTNFVDHALALHGTSLKTLSAGWPAGKSSIHDALGITEDEFWKPIHEKDDFWYSLPLYDWADQLYRRASEIGKVVVLTAPSKNPISAAGKVATLLKWKGPFFRDWILAPAKHKRKMARPGALLIDDSDENVDEFRKDGGKAILFPQRWNSNHALASVGIEYVLSELRDIA